MDKKILTFEEMHLILKEASQFDTNKDVNKSTRYIKIPVPVATQIIKSLETYIKLGFKIY